MEHRENKKAMLGVIATMLIFGTIILFKDNADLESGFLSMVRGLIGAAFLLGVMLVSKYPLIKMAE
jgi:hypothetical protein